MFSYNETSYELMDFVTYWGDFFSEQKVQPLEKIYTFSEIYKKPAGLSIQDHLNNLWTKDGIASIQEGMAKTFNVGIPYTFKPTEKAAIEMRTNPQAIPVDRSACIVPSNK